MIKVEDVSYKYKNSDRYVLENLNFEINDGEVVAIVGKNGSGKSTIGRLITGIIKLKKGNIKIDELEIAKCKEYQFIHEKIGIVFQNPENQIIFNNIYDELSFSLKDLKKSEIEEKINEALRKVEMLEQKSEDLYALSLGQKQRIMLAEILARNPKYIVLDEPTTMIDTQGKDKIYEIIKSLKKQGYTIICITNLADEILLADRVLILNEGKIACEIKKGELVEKAYLLDKYEIKKPTILEILTKLKENGIELKTKEFSIDELVENIKRLK